MADETATQAADARRRKLDALFAEQPYLSATMKAFRLPDADGAPMGRFATPPLCPSYDDSETDRAMKERRSALASCPMPALTMPAPDPPSERHTGARRQAPTVDCRHGVVRLDLLVDPGSHPGAIRVSQAPAPDVLTLSEAAEYLRFAPSTLRAWVRRGRVPCAHVGRSLRFRRAALEEWLKSRE